MARPTTPSVRSFQTRSIKTLAGLPTSGAAAPGGPWLSGLDLEPSEYSPVLGAIELAARLRAGEDPERNAFGCIASLLLNLMDYGGNLIGHPR
jgi:hypothetical protein